MGAHCPTRVKDLVHGGHGRGTGGLHEGVHGGLDVGPLPELSGHANCGVNKVGDVVGVDDLPLVEAEVEVSGDGAGLLDVCPGGGDVRVEPSNNGLDFEPGA